jgi:hypothetical protein
MTDNIVIRRAVIGTLLRHQSPVTVPELIDLVLAIRPVTWAGRPLRAKKVHNVLAHQATRGRVRRVSRGRWVADPEGFTRTTRWRYMSWESDFDRREAAVSEP